jgi:hypothetical protein
MSKKEEFPQNLLNYHLNNFHGERLTIIFVFNDENARKTLDMLTDGFIKYLMMSGQVMKLLKYMVSW